MCAAPGGKTTQMAEHMANTGAILATDVSLGKLMALKNNLARMGVVNTIVLRQDARKIKSSARFDKILLDAPCTGSGIIRKDPSRKDSRSLKDISFMSSVQKGLIQKAVMMLKDTGVMVYSTCSLEPEENEILIDWAIRNLPLEVLPYSDSFLEISPGLTCPFGKELDSQVQRCGRIHPHINDTNGMFFAILRKI
jgi:NOL1/NOP2/sun family putative RNA methylase